MSVRFCWEADQFHGLLAGCHRDEAASYMLRYLDKEGPILEAGCGLGRFVNFMDQQGFRDVRGIELSADAVRIVNEIAPNLNVTRGDVADLPFDDASIQGVVCLGVVEHFEGGPQTALREFKRVMMPGAVAIITVPYLNLVRRLKAYARIYELGERVRARRVRGSAIDPTDEVVGRSITQLGRDRVLPQHKPASALVRWPVTGPFFEYRFSTRQFKKELRAVGLSILEVARIDAVSGMFYEFGSVFVSTSDHGGRVVTRLGRVFQRALARAPWVHAHMLLFVVRSAYAEQR